MAYADLEVLVQRWSDGGHAVDMRFRTDDGQADADLALNVPITLDFEALLRNYNDTERYGRALTAMLFADQRLRGGFQRVRGFVEGADIPLRIRLRLDPAADELHGVRWEALYDPDRDTPFARSERIMLSRYLDSPSLTRIQLPTRDELQALVVVASPHNLDRFKLQPFDANAESERVRGSIGDIPTATLVSGDGGPAVSLNAICDAMRFGYTILYLVCHGTLRDGQPVLCLEDERGEATWVTGDALADRIADLSAALRPLLVVLASCQSVGLGHGAAVPSALGPRLAASGVGAVVGMQGDVPMELVARLVPRFFSELAEGGEIDRALAVARAGLAPSDPWWMPVLFLRVRDGRLWQVPATPARAPAASPVAAAASGPARAPRLLWVGAALALICALLVGLGGTLIGRSGDAPATATAEAERTTVAARATQSALLIINAGASPDTTPAPAAVVTPTFAATATPAPPAPLAAGLSMVLVSGLDVAGVEGRDLAGEIVDDLRRNVEAVPFSDVKVVRYDGVVRSEQEAAALAKVSRAAVIVWGGGSAQAVTLRVRVGDPSVFRGTPAALSSDLLHRTADVDLRFDARGELTSSSLAVLSVLNVLKTADGDGFEILRVAALIDSLKSNVTPAEVLGSGTAPLVHRYLNRYYAQPEEARGIIDAALAAEPDNPLLLIYSGVLYQRLSQYDKGYDDIQAAADAVPNWAPPLYLLAIDRYVNGLSEQALAYLNDIVDARPDDSYALAYRGAFYYLSGYPDVARGDLEAAISLGPKTALPYNYAAVLALREGRINDAIGLIAQVRERFRAQRSFDNNFYIHLFGQENLFGLTIAAVDQLLAGQNRKAIEYAQRAQAFPENPVLNDRLRSDLSFIVGFAQCNSGDDAGAADSYSAALGSSPEFALLHLLRADVRARLGDGAGAQEDLAAAAASPQAAQLKPYLDAALAGKLTCKSLLN